jgi:hypothetical protein
VRGKEGKKQRRRGGSKNRFLIFTLMHRNYNVGLVLARPLPPPPSPKFHTSHSLTPSWYLIFLSYPFASFFYLHRSRARTRGSIASLSQARAQQNKERERGGESVREGEREKLPTSTHGTTIQRSE